MKYRRIKGILFTVVLVSCIVVLAILKWRHIITGLLVTILGIITLIIFGIIVFAIGKGISGSRWDQE